VSKQVLGLACLPGMTWLTALIAVALVVAVFAITGLKPRGTRKVGGTQLMMVARVVLVLTILAVLYFVWSAR
jgi:uncharacterized membrane protein